jgi:prevent-host-death family protein
MENMISKSQFKPRALHYFREIEKTGKELIICNRGKPVLKIVPYAEDPEKALKALRNTVIKYENPTEPVGLEDWEALKLLNYPHVKTIW